MLGKRCKKRPADMGANIGHCGNRGQGLQTACGCEGGVGWELCGIKAKQSEVPLYAAVLSPSPVPVPVPCPQSRDPGEGRGAQSLRWEAAVAN